MVSHGPCGVLSRPEGRGDAERLKRLKIAVHSANAIRRRVAEKRGCWGRAAYQVESS
jgi:hypothetical protein